MFRVTYIYHSCFTVELDKTVLIFDYFKGKLPEFDKDKKIYVFVSHRHPDHFKPKIFELINTYPHIHYFLSDDIRLSNTWLSRAGVQDKLLKDYVTVIHPEKIVGYEELKIHSLSSTDEGLAYVISVDGKEIYHAGDLNNWYWSGESDKDNAEMKTRYEAEIDEISGAHFDAAFVPLDTRLDDAFGLGMDYFLTNTDSSAVFPMHMWDKYDWINDYTKQDVGSKYKNVIYDVNKDGIFFDL